MKVKSCSSISLALGGVFLMAMGIYFIFLRPPLLPEDFKYIATTSFIIQGSIPGLSGWLQKVFWVLGGYIFTTGLLTVFISFTLFRMRAPVAFNIVTIAGISSIGVMTVVNFMIESDFKWILLTFTLTWAIALTLYRLHK